MVSGRLSQSIQRSRFQGELESVYDEPVYGIPSRCHNHSVCGFVKTHNSL